VIVLWTANTERFSEVRVGLNDSANVLLQSIRHNEAEISPSTLFAVASILEGAPYINGSPQNTFVPGVIELAEQHHVYIGGDDFKSGQTKIKSVLVDFLVSSGIKPTSIVSYNHLGNNDGKNLSAPQQFRSKEVSNLLVLPCSLNHLHIGRVLTNIFSLVQVIFLKVIEKNIFLLQGWLHCSNEEQCKTACNYLNIDHSISIFQWFVAVGCDRKVIQLCKEAHMSNLFNWLWVTGKHAIWSRSSCGTT